jgi:hypothetical protein
LIKPLDVKTAYAVMGELQRDGDVMTGWCWSADRPSERLTVGLRIDGVPAGAVVAARLRLDLVHDGVCDGYHGFTIVLPPAVPTYSVIEVFERATGQVFGRLASGEVAELGIWSERVSELSEAVDVLHAGLPDQPASLGRAYLDEVVREGGRTLCRGFRGGATLARVPRIDSPAFSLVLDGSGAADELRAAVIRLAPLLRHHRAELLVIERGQTFEMQGVTRVETAGEAAEALQAAAEIAKGKRLVFLQARWTSSAGVARLLGSEPGTILLGAMAMEAARTAGLCWDLPNLSRGTARTGLVLLVDQSIFNRVGGFDRDMDDGAGLHLADLGLRLSREGCGLASWVDTAREVQLTPIRPLARRRFAAHWQAVGYSSENG